MLIRGKYGWSGGLGEMPAPGALLTSGWFWGALAFGLFLVLAKPTRSAR
jgi:hypothetical protein